MTKTLLSAALIAGLGIAAFAPQTASATDGTITFNGTVTAGTCSTITAGTANVVTLPTVSTTTLNAAGATAGSTLFNIVVSGCSGGTPAIASVATNFEVGSGVNAAGRIINTGAAGTAATGVDLQLTDINGTAINIGSSSPSTPVALASGGATMPFYVRYYATAAATAGAVKGTVAYSVVYN